jgi:spermidine synthase
MEFSNLSPQVEWQRDQLRRLCPPDNRCSMQVDHGWEIAVEAKSNVDVLFLDKHMQRA